MGSGALMEGSGKIYQIVLMVLNLLVWIGTILLFVFGGLGMGKNPYINSMFDYNSSVTVGAILVIVVGVFAFAVAFLGCMGAFKENKCMLLTYFIIVLLLFILLLTAGILALVFKDKATDVLRGFMMKSLRKYKDGSTEPLTKEWDNGQAAMKCCGVEGPDDWIVNLDVFTSSYRYPKSCCIRDEATDKVLECQKFLDTDKSYTTGCFTKAEAIVKSHGKHIGGVAIGIAFFMLIALICAILLYLEIRKKGAQ